MDKIQTALLHYTAPPVVGGVEAVIQAHAGAFIRAGCPVAIIAGRGDPEALPAGVDLHLLPEIDSRHPQIAALSERLSQGQLPPNFDGVVDDLEQRLAPLLQSFDNLIVHNVFTKHFNLPLTAALYRLLEAGRIHHCISWGHDFSWTSPSSRSKVFPDYPWDLLRSYRREVRYVVVSRQRQQELAGLYGCPPDEIQVIHNGVDPTTLLALSKEGRALAERLDLLESDLVLLMPVRVTQAKNVEFALRVVAALKAQGCRPKLVLTGPPDPHDADSMAYFESLRDLRLQLDVEEEMRFVFESGPDPGQPLYIDPPAVGELYRLSDVLLMPSHREGFGMPVLEAGLVGLPVVCTDIPAAREIGGEDVLRIEADEEPAQVARRILAWAEANPQQRLRRRVRQHYSWTAIFERQIRPLLRKRGER